MGENTNLVRQLVPKSYHFDGYDLVDCRNSRDKPFFGDNTIQMGEYFLNIRRQGFDKISLEYESVCKNGVIYFNPYYLTINEFVKRLKDAVKTGSDFIYFEIVPVYDNNRDMCIKCQEKTNDCIRMKKDHPNVVMGAVSFDIEDIRRALASYYEIGNSKGGLNMKRKNNFFGMNFEFGPSKDPNLASTMLGVAVRKDYNGPWFTYDPVSKIYKNLANVKLGNLPVYLLPVSKPQPGDLIKWNGNYVWINEVTPNNTFKVVDAATGQINELLATESLMPGFNLYTKVVAMDMKSLTDPSGKSEASNILAAMLMMQWAKGDNGADFSLDDINDDSFNGMGAMLPLVLSQSGGGTFGNIFGGEGGQINLPMLMMLGGNDSDDNGGFMQMYVLSQLMNPGGSTGLEGIIPGIGNTPAVKIVSPGTEDAVVCEKCGVSYPEGTNFCPKCGGKTRSNKATCSACGAELMPGAEFCHKCGKKVGPATCPECGAEIPDGSAFCPKCGKSLTEKKEEQQPTEVKAE